MANATPDLHRYILRDKIMGFKKFTNRMQSVSPAVTYGEKSGRFIFNQPAVKSFKLDRYSFCWLYYDKDMGEIGFEFLTSPENGSCKVANYRYTFNVAGMSFVNHYEIKFNQPKQMDIKKVSDNFYSIKI
jgi:hypothetical protein